MAPVVLEGLLPNILLFQLNLEKVNLEKVLIARQGFRRAIAMHQ
jgi:hypothetical protein